MNFEEKQFIQEILGPLATTAGKESFDDAVVIDLADVTGHKGSPFLVYSLDQPSFVRHANSAVDPFRFYGRWIAGTTCNDIIAMGARCRGFSLALAAPPETKVDEIRSMILGVQDVLRYCGATYEGGNLDSSALTTVGMAWGVVSRLGLVRRSGAKPGDAIVVTGELGLGWLEYQLRSRGLLSHVQTEDMAAFLGYKAMPIGAASAIAAVAERGWFTSGMDLSDGLVEFLYTIKARNALGCVIDGSAIPISGTTRRNLQLLGLVDSTVVDVLERKPGLIALEPGYDSPLRHAFTVVPNGVREAQAIFQSHRSSLHVIGEVTDDRTVLLRHGDIHDQIPPFWDDQLRQGSAFDAWLDFLRTFA